MIRLYVAEAVATSILLLVPATARAAFFEPHAEVRGADVAVAEVREAAGPWRNSAWDSLDTTSLPPGDYEIRLRIDGGKDGTAVEVPQCAAKRTVAVDGAEFPSPPGPAIVRVSAGAHEITIALAVSKYERRIACGGRPRLGAVAMTREGLNVMAFGSPYGVKGGGRAVVYIPPGHDTSKPAALLVGLHPWNGTMWTYAAYSQLLTGARARDVVLLLPSGLGNSLYTADAEDETMRAIDALSDIVAIDPRAVSIWGASMGGAGATTVSFHHPDRFAFAASFFGDSKYDLSSYVRSILKDERGARLVNAIDVVDNALHLPVWLVHGIDDTTSPIRQSDMLAAAMRERRLDVRLVRASHMGHEGALVAQFLPEIVSRAAASRVPAPVTRIAYRSVRPWDTGAYGVHILRASQVRDAFVAVEAREDGVHVTRAEGVRAVVIDPGALGTAADHLPPLLLDSPLPVDVRWAERSP